jgi:membrane-associated protease RseP (regulator of RpoE activity)
VTADGPVGAGADLAAGTELSAAVPRRVAPAVPAAGEPGEPGEVAAGEPGGPTDRRRVVQLLVVLAVLVGLALLAHAGYVLVVIAALVLIVMLHELGHFATAKWSGMKVTEYFLGFGPRLWSIRRGETEYGVKAIPAGGYVRIVGMTTAEEVEELDEPRTYRRATFPRRLAVGVAGSAMHYVMAFLLMFGFFAFVGVAPTSGAEVAGLYSFASGRTPAQLAGLQAGDVFVSFDGHAVTDQTQFQDFVRAHAGTSLTLVVRRDGRLVTLHVTPVDGRHVSQQGSHTPLESGKSPVGVIGIILEAAGNNQTYGFFGSIAQATGQMGVLTTDTVTGVGQVFSPHGIATMFHDLATSTSSAPQTPAQQAADADRPVSVVGVVQIASQAASQDIGELLFLLAYVNIFFGLFNLFPMLPLDGGHVAIAVYERIRSRRGRRYFADVQKMMPYAYAFLLIIGFFFISGLYLDIVSPIHVGG